MPLFFVVVIVFVCLFLFLLFVCCSVMDTTRQKACTAVFCLVALFLLYLGLFACPVDCLFVLCVFDCFGGALVLSCDCCVVCFCCFAMDTPQKRIMHCRDVLVGLVIVVWFVCLYFRLCLVTHVCLFYVMCVCFALSCFFYVCCVCFRFCRACFIIGVCLLFCYGHHPTKSMHCRVPLVCFVFVVFRCVCLSS